MLQRFLAQQKRQTILWCFLCAAIFLTCFPSYFLNQTEYSIEAGNSSATLQSGAVRGAHPCPDFVNDRTVRDQHSLLLSRSAASHRIPLRLPVPHLWISFAQLPLAGLPLCFWRKRYRREREECTRNYIIRYIHDQDGETYRSSFLF